jgi:hypothetical protein
MPRHIRRVLSGKWCRRCTQWKTRQCRSRVGFEGRRESMKQRRVLRSLKAETPRRKPAFSGCPVPLEGGSSVPLLRGLPRRGPVCPSSCERHFTESREYPNPSGSLPAVRRSTICQVFRSIIVTMSALVLATKACPTFGATSMPTGTGLCPN